MLRKISLVSPPAPLFVLLVLFASAGKVEGHRLDAQAFLLPGNKLQVEAWFSSGEPARGATINVFGADGRTIADGKLNERGIFICSLTRREALRIVILAGSEHRKE